MGQELFPGWRPPQIAKYYGFPEGYTGKGQSIGIVSLGGAFQLSDVHRDFEVMGAPVPDVRQVLVDEAAITPEQDKKLTYETQLDIGVIGSLCPEAAITLYRGPNTPVGFANTVARAISEHNSVISISWGSKETDSDKHEALELILKMAASHVDVTICAAVGDGGSSSTRALNGNAIPAEDGLAHVQYPASSPYVLACGGTELWAASNKISERVWNNSKGSGAIKQGGAATGGGVSALFDLPAWQKAAGISIPSVNTGNKGRVVPDVSGFAATGDWEIYEYSDALFLGGTSAVAPLWASLITHVNEARTAEGKPALGFLNDKLYKLAAKGGYFTDITVGNNRPEANYPGYKAQPGFDACTGWGAPIAGKLFKALVDL